MNLEQKISMIEEQFDDILSHAGDHGNMKLTYNYKENEFGGNPYIWVDLKANINSIPYKEKKFTYHMASQTEIGFINEIKAWLFDMLDGVANL